LVKHKIAISRQSTDHRQRHKFMQKIAFTYPGGDLPAPSGIPASLQGNLGESGAKVLQTGLNLLFYGAVILAIVFIIYSGIEWITSTGDPNRIQSAKKRLLYAIVGLVVVSLAFLIFNLVAGVLGKSPGQLLNSN